MSHGSAVSNVAHRSTNVDIDSHKNKGLGPKASVARLVTSARPAFSCWVRILFVFDPWRSAILLVAGDKAGSWNKWYARMIPRADQLCEIYLKERQQREGSQ